MNYNIYNNLRNIEIIAWSTLIFGILLYFSDKFIVQNHLKRFKLLKIYF